MDVLLNQKGGIVLDVGCGENKQPGAVGMDMRPLPGVDIVHDLEELPWPLPDECCLSIIARHIVEHINPHRGGFLRWMDECWRVLKFGGQLAIVTPHAFSVGFAQDPTHCNMCNEKTWLYFDPINSADFAKVSGGDLYGIYRPKPWAIRHLNWSPEANIEVLLAKRREDWSYTQSQPPLPSSDSLEELALELANLPRYSYGDLADMLLEELKGQNRPEYVAMIGKAIDLQQQGMGATQEVVRYE